MFKTDADHPFIQYTGRMDFSNPKSILMPYPGTYIKFKFKGTLLKLRFSQEIIGNYIGYVIDNKFEGKFLLKENSSDSEYEIINGLDNTVHDVIVIRRTDFTRGNCYFNGVIIDGLLLAPEKRPIKRIECFGDSLTAGAISEAYGYVGKKDPIPYDEYCNGWYSYANILARLLDAEVHNNGQGGLALLNGTGFFCKPNQIGLETTFDKLNPSPLRGELTNWDFSRYNPHLVLISIGQNDGATTPEVPYDQKKREYWKSRYKMIINNLQHKYSGCYFILTTSIMIHDLAWDDMLDEIVIEINDPVVTSFRYQRAGIGTPGHIRKSEAEEMALELKRYIDCLNIYW
ncbi:MAG: acetyl esterase [Haloplasmataceae bacterium]|jgi:hypothetical protein|nr:acetyl esterase [Haloplasmataceae bacterium]